MAERPIVVLSQGLKLSPRERKRVSAPSGRFSITNKCASVLTCHYNSLQPEATKWKLSSEKDFKCVCAVLWLMFPRLRNVCKITNNRKNLGIKPHSANSVMSDNRELRNIIMLPHQTITHFGGNGWENSRKTKMAQWKNTFLQGKIKKKLEIRQAHSVHRAVMICHFESLGLGYQRGL